MQSTQSAVDLAPQRSAILARRLAATLIDGCIGLMFLTAAAIVAFAWLLLTSGFGGREPSSLANSVAFSIVLAAVPAWYGLLAASTTTGSATRTATRTEGTHPRGATPGQRRAGLVTEGTRVQRLVRLALHPLGSPGWWWLAGVASLATVPGIPLVLVAAGLLVLGGGAISAVLAALRPSVPALHDRIAGTRTSFR